MSPNPDPRKPVPTFGHDELECIPLDTLINLVDGMKTGRVKALIQCNADGIDLEEMQEHGSEVVLTALEGELTRRKRMAS